MTYVIAIGAFTAAAILYAIEGVTASTIVGVLAGVALLALPRFESWVERRFG